jgi:hypothetical protein
MNDLGLSIVLRDLAGEVTDTPQQCQVFGVAIKTALAGTLTLTGVTNTNGTPASWVIPSTSVGVFQAPGSGLASSLRYVYSNPADANKALVAWRPL